MSSFLLDTHAFIWLTEDDDNLPGELKAAIEEADLVYVSIASFWEIAIKLNIGKLSLRQSYEAMGDTIKASDILILPITFADTIQIRHLPLHHRDPFDRMLIAQAINRSLPLISADPAFDAYPIQRMWA